MDEPHNLEGNEAKATPKLDIEKLNLEIALDPKLTQQMQKLHQLTIYGRWSFVALLWLVVAPWSLWSLRAEIALGQQYFTWVLVRYAIVDNRLPSLALGFCIAMTTAVLVWQSRNILWGLPAIEKQRLHQQVLKISQQGASHPLWKWIK